MQVTLSPAWITLFFLVLSYVVAITGFLFKISANVSNTTKLINSMQNDIKSGKEILNDHETRLAITEDRRHEYRRNEDKVVHGLS